jgi:hypothetical protein
MGFSHLFYPWGFIFQALAIVHFIRRRPDGFWLWIILIGGALGAFVYFIAEVVPDFGLLRVSFQRAGRRRRIAELDAIVKENSAIGNVEELADLCFDDRQFARARELYDKVIASPQVTSVDPYYRRGLSSLELGDAAAAATDLERVVAKEPKYDFFVRRDCWRTPMRSRAVLILRSGSSCPPPNRRHSPRPTTTTRRSWLPGSDRPKRATGPSAS